MNNQSIAPYLNANLTIEDRVADLVQRMTLEEKISQMIHDAPAIERLGIPQYSWWNECLHGVGRAGMATVFPQAIGLAATWNDALIRIAATAISDEARAKHHEALRRGERGRYQGLTFWSPNINIFRDPRWGRGQETYGEDPYLTARLGVAFVQGLQGDDPKYLKLVATPKHFAVHSGPEAERHHFDARVEERDLRQTYLPAFEACVRETGVKSVMGAYNRTNGEPCCASPTLLEDILRNEWGFDGYVVSDCGAIGDIYQHHRIVESAAEAAALAVRAGCDLNCGETYGALLEAVEKDLIPEAYIDRAVARLFTARYQLGMFDPQEEVPYARIPIEVVASPEHRFLARNTAQESIVLLKNEGDLLPLSKNVGSIAVIGPNADDRTVLLGNYFGTPSESIGVLGGIRRAVAPKTTVNYAQGCGVTGPRTRDSERALQLAAESNVVIFVGGLSQEVEGEEGQQEGVRGARHSQGDRDSLDLPGAQEQLLRELADSGKPVILVLLTGSALAIGWAKENLPAILVAWYPGEAGGLALADVLFGDYNPAGRLPVTFYASIEDLPAFEDYSMQGRTYRYFEEEPVYAFGFGLSYTQFAYTDLHIEPEAVSAGEPVNISVTVENTGYRSGDEVVQVYLTDQKASAPVPIRQLQGFRRIHLQPGEKQTLAFTLTPRQMSLIDEEKRRIVEPGSFQVAVGGRQPQAQDFAEPGLQVLIGQFKVTGAAHSLP